MQDTPSNETLAVKIDALAAVIIANQEVINEKQALILAQTTKTNGRVTSLEKFKNIWVGVIIVVDLMILPLAMAIILHYMKL